MKKIQFVLVLIAFIFLVTTVQATITKESLNTTIFNLEQKLQNLSQNLSLEWYSPLIFNQTNINQINTTLQETSARLLDANETDYPDIKNQLDSIDQELPLAVVDSFVLQPSLYLSNPDAINPSFVTSLGGGNYNSSEKENIANKISTWQENNLDVKISTNVKTLEYFSTTQDVLTLITIDIDPQSYSNSAYFVFNVPENLNSRDIKSEETLEDLDGAVGLVLDLTSAKTIQLAIPGKQEFSSIQFFISPTLNTFKEKKGTIISKKSFFPILLMIIIVIVVIIALMFIWKNKGGGSVAGLFNNESDVISLINFITMGQARGMQRKEIEEQLMNTGWNKKQIDYAFKQIGKPSKKDDLPFDLDKYNYKY